MEKFHKVRANTIEIFGNITITGLAEIKKEEWKGDKQDPRITVNSLCDDTYVPPESYGYRFRRWARPKPIRTRESDLIYKGYPKDHPAYAKCNPITWECKEEEPQNCL